MQNLKSKLHPQQNILILILINVFVIIIIIIKQNLYHHRIIVERVILPHRGCEFFLRLAFDDQKPFIFFYDTANLIN
jgi:hypothetical protein